MNTHSIALLAGVLLSGVVASLQTGCVAGSTYEQAQERAYAQHQQDQRQILDLSLGNKRLKERVDALESSLQSSREQLTRTEHEWKEIRDELLRLKIEKEQQPGRRQQRLSGERPPSDIENENARLRDRLEDAKRRVKELFQQLQHMLEQF
jgi:predicted RNase H-like nuclease (RuvC/YqgF family)